MALTNGHWSKHVWFVRQRPPAPLPGVIEVSPDATKPLIHIIAYGPEKVFERDLDNPDDIAEFLGFWPVTWVDVAGFGDPAVLSRIAQRFGIHPLTMEDVVNAHQRPRVEEFPEHVYMVLQMPATGRSGAEQVSLFLGETFVLTFQEEPGDCLDPLRERIRKRRGRIRDLGPDDLAYAIIDRTVDAYFPVLERMGEELDELEASVLARSTQSQGKRIHRLRSEMLLYRRAIWPLRETVSALLRENQRFIRPETRIYLRDVYDHVVQLMDLVETYRETAASLMEVYLSSVSQRLNEVMKVLTIISTIFMPLTFIAGIYGMNFHTDRSPWNMPELTWRFGYVFSLALMAVVAGAMGLYFRRKGWLGGGQEDGDERRDQNRPFSPRHPRG